MAETVDFGDYESNFLDSMLEVEMTEEDGEVKISQTDDSSQSTERDLPPIPRFDLQSETLFFKDVYSNSVMPAKPSNVIRTVPAPVPGTTIAVPVVQPAPMIVIHSNLLKSNNVTIKPSAVQTVTAKPSSVFTNVSTKDVGTQDLANDFMKRVFGVDFVKKVYKQKDELSVSGEEEENYYKSIFVDVSKVQLCRLHCTICDKHLGCGKNIEKKICIHSMLKVLTCKICHEFYGDGNFPCDEGDHCEIYCRWCGQGGALICCSFCPKVFCKRCVTRNYNRSYLKAVEKASEWACFVCAQKPLWPHRAVCRALMEYVKSRTDVKIKDTSVCCKPFLVNKKIVTAVERNKIFLSGGQTFQMKANERESEKKSQFVTSLPKTVTNNDHIVVKNLPSALKLNDQTKGPVTVVGKGQVIPPGVTSKMTTPTTPSLNQNNKTNSVPKLSSLSGVTIPMINTPVYHGQTLITPPKNNSLQRRLNKEANNSTVRVTVADYVNVDINKIPVAKIPPYVQGVILRLNFPDNKVQLVRLVKDGGTEESPNFPIPVFENSENLDFLESSLEDSFKLTKMLFERLMKIKEKLNSTTKVTKESVYKSSVKKLSFIYEKARELMKELDDNLLNNYELWKSEKEQEKEVKIIELSDDDGNSPGKQQTSIFDNRPKIFAQDDDSDLEVIATGKMQTSQRILRSSKRSTAFRSPVKPSPRKSSPGKSSPGKSIPGKSTPGKPPPVKPSTVKSSSVKPSPVKSTPVKPSPVKSTPVKPSPVKSTSVKPPPVKSSPVKPSPIKVSPVNPSPELVDLSRYANKKKYIGRPRKRIKLSEEVAEVFEKDPLAVSDTEPEMNGEGKDSFQCDSGTFTSAIEIKEENLCFL